MPSPARSSEMNCTFAAARSRPSASRIVLARDADLAGRVRGKASQRAQHFDRAGADLAGEADHRAALGDEIEILDDRRDAESA